MKEKLKTQRGITLIALVITIVVLIILAGVAINMTLSQNGIFNKAKNASDQYNESSIRERIETGILNVQADKKIAGEECTIDTLVSELPSQVSGLTISKDGDSAIGELDGYEYVIDINFKVSVNGNTAAGTETTPSIPPTPQETAFKATYMETGVRKMLALDEEGNLWGCGSNSNGALALGTTRDTTQMTKSVSEMKFKKVSTAGGNTAAIDEEGNLWALGYGQLGESSGNNGQYASSLTFVKVKNGVKFVEVSVGHGHSLAIDEEGNLWGWGSNYYGELGTTPTTSGEYKATPSIIKSGTKFSKIAAGRFVTVALDTAGNLYTCGLNDENGLGNAGSGDTSITVSGVSSPINANLNIRASGTKFKEIAISSTPTGTGMGSGIGLAIDTNGKLWGWGNIGIMIDSQYKSTSNVPIKLTDEMTFSKVSIGAIHSLVVDTDGKLWSYGSNIYGQLGIGNTNSSANLTQVQSTNKFISISAGDYLSTAIDEDNNVWVWGQNTSGQLGLGTTENVNVPTLLKNN